MDNKLRKLSKLKSASLSYDIERQKLEDELEGKKQQANLIKQRKQLYKRILFFMVIFSVLWYVININKETQVGD